MKKKKSNLENIAYGVASKAKKLFKKKPFALRKGPFIKYGLLAGSVIGPSIGSSMNLILEDNSNKMGVQNNKKGLKEGKTISWGRASEYKSGQYSSNLKTTTELPTNLNNPFYNLNPRVAWNHPEGPMKMKRYGDGVDPNGGDYLTTQADLDKMISDGVSITVTNYNYWQDMNWDGTFGDWKDQEIMRQKINGEISSTFIWELYPSKAKEYAAKFINLEDLHNNYGAGWLCTNFSLEAELLGRSIYDKPDSRFALDNGTERQHDISRDWTYGIPIDLLSVVLNTPSNDGSKHHSITDVYTGEKEGDVTDFLNNYTKIDFSIGKIYNGAEIFERIDPNEYATRVVDGYFNPSFFGVTHATVGLVGYNFDNGNVIITSESSNLVKEWEPFRNNGVNDKSIEYPVSRTLEASPDVLAEAAQIIDDSEVTGILFPNNTLVKKTVTNGQDADATKREHYNFTIPVDYEVFAGEYGDKGQMVITVEDTQLPTYDFATSTFSDASGSPVTVTTRRDTINRSCNGLVGKANEYEKGTDVSGNSLEVLTKETDFDNRIMPKYVSAPADVEYVGNPNDANPLPGETGMPVFSHPTGNVEIHYSDETVRESFGEKDVKRTLWGTSDRSDCERSQDTTHMIYIRSGVGIEDDTKYLKDVLVSHDGTKVSYVGEGSIKLDTDRYSLGGKLIQPDNEPYVLSKGESKSFPKSSLKGLQLLRVENMENGKSKLEKVVSK